jgi:methylthioribose-1-phosphate isomerase
LADSLNPPPNPDAAAPTDPELTGADLARRRFFRRFASDVVGTAATIAGAATALQRASAEAASAILDPERGAEALGGIAAGSTTTTTESDAEPAAPSGFRTPFRFASDDLLMVIDQRRLPEELHEFQIRSAPEAIFAIREMIVRGAPAIGQVAAIGLAMTAARAADVLPFARRATIRGAATGLIAARPTAVNLRWAVDRLMARYDSLDDLNIEGEVIAKALRDEADAIVAETTAAHGRLAEFGLAELPATPDRELRVLTHCNTGPLACGQFGTALGIIQAAHHAERPIHVWVDETRPYLQGARLTTWELKQAGVPHTLIADVAAGFVMSRGEVDAILVGADRVAANGDTANKIGTYTLAVLAARHRIPFYVCAPINTVDLATEDGASIEIEERPPEEVLEVRDRLIAPPGTDARNPAFDVTPAELITAIVTDEGALHAPFGPALRDAVARSEARRAEAAATAAAAAETVTATTETARVAS